MSAFFFHASRKSFYHRAIIPRRLRPFFKGRVVLSKDSHNPEERLSGRRRGVDDLLVNEEVNLFDVDLREEIDEV